MSVYRLADTGRSRSHRSIFVASLSLITGIALHAAVSSGSSSDAGDNRPRAHGTVTAVAGASSSTAGSVDGPGPSRVDYGVPAGFRRTADGAVAAAASFVTTGQALLDMDPLAAEDAIRQMASVKTVDAQVADVLGKLRFVRTELADGKGPIVYRQAVIAWRVDSFTSERASVAIWNVGVLSRDGVAPPQAGWAVSVFDLVWERGDWKIDRETVTPGPAPILDNSAAPATAAQLTASLRGFTDFGSYR